MGVRQTHTYAELGLSQTAYDEIKRKLADAGYQHAFMEDGAIDMHGISVTLEHNPAPGHASDCATHNAPALPIGPCDCDAGSGP